MGEPTGGSSPPEPTVERVLRVATVLFAEHGFHAVTTRALAAAADVNIATLHYHFGTKQDLYRAVFRRQFETEHARLGSVLDEAGDTVVTDPAAFAAFLRRLVRVLVTLIGAHPEAAQLWVRRWMDEVDGLDDIEAEFGRPILAPLKDLILRARQGGGLPREGADARLLVPSVTWLLYGYYLGGVLDRKGRRADPRDPELLADFEAFLLSTLSRQLGLPEPRTPPESESGSGGP